MQSMSFLWNTMKRRPLRSLLTLLQIAIGVAAVTVVFHQYLATQVGLGRMTEGWDEIYNLQMVQEFQGPNNSRGYQHDSIREPALQELRELESILAISPMSSNWSSEAISGGMRYIFRGFYGVSPDFPGLVDLKLLGGTFFTWEDYQSQQNVLVVSESFARAVMGRTDVVGEVIQLGQHDRYGMSEGPPRLNWTILGVFDDSPFASIETYSQFHVLSPATVNLWGPQSLEHLQHHQVWVRFRPGMGQLARREIKLLMETGQFEARLEPVNRMMGEAKQAGTYFFLFLGAFAFVAVVVSSLGSMTMFLVAVVERTREIGLRRAMGATRGRIFLQFVSESALLCLTGGIMGVGLASLLQWRWAELLNFFGTWFGLDVVRGLSWQAGALGVGLALVTGVVFSIYPASQAATISPLEALREG